MSLRLAPVAATFATCACVGCGSLLGGLDEGTSAPAVSPRARDGGPPADGAAGAGCVGWLSDFRYRAPVSVSHEGPAIRGYQVRIVLPTSSLVASGKLRSDGADLRVTSGDGVSELPYWIESGVGTESTALWVRLDLADQTTAVRIYYGNPDTVAASSAADTFVSGVIDDPMFDRSDAWGSFHDGIDDKLPSPTNAWSVTLSHDDAALRMVRPASARGAQAGICQSMLFPAGSSYRFVFDANVTLADHGNAAVTLGGISVDTGGYVLWATRPNEIGLRSNVESAALAPGIKTVCFLANAVDSESGQGAAVSYSGLRVRRYVTPEPSARPLGAEEERCR